MNREFLEHYDRELKILYERSKEFAQEYPGVAERLGELVKDKMDPGLVGLLEGAAFMAARVQLKLKSEFSEFTAALIDQVLPNFLAPIPSAALVQAQPPYEDTNLLPGIRFKRGAAIDAVYVERERRVSCRYRLRGDLTIWPIHLEIAEYYPAQPPLQALGLELKPGTLAGLRLGFRRLAARPGAPAPNAGRNPKPLSIKDVPVDALPIHIVGQASDAIMLYEQLFANCRRITVRYLDALGDPRFMAVDAEALEQVGFGEDETLSEPNDSMFAGFELLRDYFTFPEKYLGFRLTGLRRLLSRIDAPAFEILFEFDASIARLGSVVSPAMLALYAVPASNLFEMNCSRIPIRKNEHEHHVVPDRTRMLDFEAHRIIDVSAHYSGRSEKVPVYPLYSLPAGNVPVNEALFYTVRRVPRRQSVEERRTGSRSSYTGTELFVSLYEPSGVDDRERVRELSIRALTSNRHLTDQLPTGASGADFVLADDTSLPFRCVAGPTPPRESLVNFERKQRDMLPSGAALWRIISFLSLNHLGLVDRDARDGGAALREVLSLFTDLSDAVTERRIRGVEGVSSRPIVRRLRQKNGFNAARGLEITVTVDEKAFEGHGVFLLGATLDRFFAEYASMNNFTETVIVSRQRGALKRWPGAGRPRAAVVSYRSDLSAEPYGFDFFAVMRNLERTAKRKPRIGNSAVTAEEVVNLGQDPFMEFPASNLTGYEENEAGTPRVQTRFLGFFGPQGALPINTTLEAYQWSLARDKSFARFTDIFSNRFLQLFFRAWADARPIAQYDRPAEDKFFGYVGAFSGIGTPAMRRRDSVDDITKLGFTGLVASQVKSAMRLKQLIRGAFGVDVDIEERVGSWLPFEAGDRSRIGEAGSTLGLDLFVGARAYTINEKVRIKIRTADLRQYRAFLPGGNLNEQLTDLVFFYLGFRYEFDVQLSLPARYAPAARLGVSGELGLTAWMQPKTDAGDDEHLDDARFHPMERRAAGTGAKAGARAGGKAGAAKRK